VSVKQRSDSGRHRTGPYGTVRQRAVPHGNAVIEPVAEPGGRGRLAPLAPMRKGMAPLIRLLRRPSACGRCWRVAGSAAAKIGGRSKKRSYVHVFCRGAPKKFFCPPWVETLAPPLNRTRVFQSGIHTADGAMRYRTAPPQKSSRARLERQDAAN
jgi:hypothetical protein